MSNDSDDIHDVSTAATNASTDQATDFATNLTGILNGGTLSLMISIGHKTHLCMCSNLLKAKRLQELLISTNAMYENGLELWSLDR